jgi:hypothetical protein
MRSLGLQSLGCLLLWACGSVPAGTPQDPGPDPVPASSILELVTPELSLAPGEEKTYCYYTTLANTEAIGVRRFESTMTTGSHHLILFATRRAMKPDGTVAECNFLGGQATPTSVPIWVYSAQSPEWAMDMPPGVGMTLDAQQPVFVQMHYLNASPTTTLRPKVTIRMRLHDTSGWVQARPYVTYDTRIRVPAGQTGEIRGECAVPETAKFFLLSTHSHRFTTRAQVFDGEALVVDTTDWEHPAVGAWSEDPFYRFQSGKLSYRCAYANTTRSLITTGDSALTDEMCMAVGYFFPAGGARFCIDGFTIPF